MTLLDTHWQERSACGLLDPVAFDALFFADISQPKYVAKAKELCASCPVLAECFEDCERLEKNLGISSLFGIFAGETARERYRRRTGKEARLAIAQEYAEGRRTRRGA